MKYENAKDILPAQLLAEVQKYAGGKLLYIPVENESKSWGETSGYRQKLLKRNVMITNKYKAGATIWSLAEEYFLSLDSIKKIVYGKKEKELLFEPTVVSAVCYANAGLLEEWLTLYYRIVFEMQEPLLAGMICCGVVKVPLRLVENKVSESGKSTKVELVNNRKLPLIITYQNGEFEIVGQRELYDSLVEQKINAHPAIIMVRNEEYAHYERLYGRHFVVVS
jgi:hypothetical protein